MKPRTLTILTLLMLNFCYAFGQTLADTPFANIDFSSGDWLLVFNEIKHKKNWTKEKKAMDETIQIIDNDSILDSLKVEFTCNLDEMIDGLHEYVITIYKNGKKMNEYVWDNPNNFDLGNLQAHLEKASSEYFQTNSITKLNKKINRWSKKGQYIISNKFDKQMIGDYYVQSYKKIK